MKAAKVLKVFLALSIFLTLVSSTSPIVNSHSSNTSNEVQAKGFKFPSFKPKPKPKKPKKKVVKTLPPLKAKTRTYKGKKQVQATYYNDKTEWVNIKNGALANKKHSKSGVKFDSKGFPKFKSYGSITLPNKYIKSVNDTQFKHANYALAKNKSALKKFKKSEQKLIKRGKTPKGYTWHHHQTRGYMQLVKTTKHEATGHTGGKKIWGTK